jgi:hypothetical protein
VNCPNDRNIIHNENEKRIKYTELKIELERIWDIHFQIIPIVIGALGAVSTGLKRFLEVLGLNASEYGHIQDSVIRSTCAILRKYVTQSGLPLKE